MADQKRVIILNQREGKVVLPADPEDLKKNPKAPHRTLLSGQTLEVSADEAPKILRYKGLVDASKLVASGDSSEVKRLKADLAAAKAENAKLKKAAGGDAGDDSETDDVQTDVLDAKKGVAVLLPSGSTGVIQSVNKSKKTAKVKLDENGNVSEFQIADLKPAPADPAA